jgi:hypothetical protein
MSIAFETATHPGYIRADCTGDFSLDGMVALFERAFAAVAAAGSKALLLDVTRLADGEPSMAERYELAVRVAEMQAVQQPRIRLAVLGHEPLIHPERFGEIVATRHGAVARTFTDEAQAVDWLLAGKT